MLIFCYCNFKTYILILIFIFLFRNSCIVCSNVYFASKVKRLDVSRISRKLGLYRASYKGM